MKILMLTSSFGSGYGMGYSSYKEAKCFADLGHEVTVAHCNQDIDAYTDNRIKFIYLPIKKIKFIDFFFFYFSLKKFFKKVISINEFDLIYIQSLEFGLLNLPAIKQPIFYFARSSMIGLNNVLKKEGIRKNLFNKLNFSILVHLEKKCLRYAKKVFVKSKIMAGEVKELYGVNSSKLFVVSGGIDENDFKVNNNPDSDFIKNLSIPLNTKIILYAGRVVPQKGLIYLIKAALELLEKYNFVVVVAGEHKNKKYFNSIVELINNSVYKKSFYFIGHVNQLDMNSIFNIADCVVTPSLYEPFGMVNLQAAFLGKTVITTEVTGSIDLLGKYSRLNVVKSGSVMDIKNSLKKVLNNQTNYNLANYNFKDYLWIDVARQILK